jgi:hypothetical protein
MRSCTETEGAGPGRARDEAPLAAPTFRSYGLCPHDRLLRVVEARDVVTPDRMSGARAGARRGAPVVRPDCGCGPDYPDPGPRVPEDDASCG